MSPDKTLAAPIAEDRFTHEANLPAVSVTGKAQIDLLFSSPVEAAGTVGHDDFEAVRCCAFQSLVYRTLHEAVNGNAHAAWIISAANK